MTLPRYEGSIPALTAPTAIIDTETTGFSTSKGDRLVEVAVVHLDGGKITSSWSSLINPCRPVGPSTRVHRITDDMVAPAPKFSEIAGLLVDMLKGRVVVAHHMNFDLRFLTHEFSLAGLQFPSDAPLRCTLEGSRFRLPGLASHSLASLSEHYGIDLDDAHCALDDTLATAKVYLALLGETPGVQVADPRLISWPEAPAVRPAMPRPSAATRSFM